MQENVDPGTVTQRKIRSLLQTIAIGIVGFFIDQITKHQFFQKLSDANVQGWHLVRLTAHTNYGISFNLPLPTWIPILIAVGVMCTILWSALSRPPRSWLALVALGCLLGGAAGNAFDRITYGFVRDWLLWFELSAINLADALIVLGCLGLWWAHRAPSLTQKRPADVA